MHRFLLFIFVTLFSTAGGFAQTITYSEIERSDNRNANFEIIGRFNDNFLIYKNIYKRQEFTVYNNDMSIKENVKLDYVSDKTENIDFISYPDHVFMIWQYQKGGTFTCKGAKVDGAGKLIGEVTDMDTTRFGIFTNPPSYDLTWSEDKKKILLYKTQSRNDTYYLTAKVYDENLKLLDSTKFVFEYNDRREAFGELQIDNEGTIIFTKERQNARAEYVNTLEVNFRKLYSADVKVTNIPLGSKQLIQDANIKIDNLNRQYLINSFAYKNNGGNINGILSAVISRDSFIVTRQVINIFDDSLITKLSGNPGWRTAFDNFYLRNIILKKDGGFLIASEEYYKQRRYSGNYDDRFNPYNGYSGFNRGYYSSPSDYYFYNRGYYGYYRPYGTDSRDVLYNYNDVVTFSFTKDLKLQWNSVINKTTSDIDTDNYLSFGTMNAGGEIHLLFLQKDNNKQIVSNYALQPDGTITRYATLKSKENGYYFMPRLSRQTGARQVIMPCIVRNNIAFAKIDF